MNDENEIPQSVITIQFAAPGAVLMGAKWENCYPAQLLVAGDYLTRKARQLMEEAERQKRMEDEANRISTPSPKIVVPK